MMDKVNIIETNAKYEVHDKETEKTLKNDMNTLNTTIKNDMNTLNTTIKNDMKTLESEIKNEMAEVENSLHNIKDYQLSDTCPITQAPTFANLTMPPDFSSYSYQVSGVTWLGSPWTNTYVYTVSRDNLAYLYSLGGTQLATASLSHCNGCEYVPSLDTLFIANAGNQFAFANNCSKNQSSLIIQYSSFTAHNASGITYNKDKNVFYVVGGGKISICDWNGTQMVIRQTISFPESWSEGQGQDGQSVCYAGGYLFCPQAKFQTILALDVDSWTIVKNITLTNYASEIEDITFYGGSYKNPIVCAMNTGSYSYNATTNSNYGKSFLAYGEVFARAGVGGGNIAPNFARGNPFLNMYQVPVGSTGFAIASGSSYNRLYLRTGLWPVPDEGAASLNGKTPMSSQIQYLIIKWVVDFGDEKDMFTNIVSVWDESYVSRVETTRVSTNGYVQFVGFGIAMSDGANAWVDVGRFSASACSVGGTPELKTSSYKAYILSVSAVRRSDNYSTI